MGGANTALGDSSNDIKPLCDLRHHCSTFLQHGGTWAECYRWSFWHLAAVASGIFSDWWLYGGVFSQEFRPFVMDRYSHRRGSRGSTKPHIVTANSQAPG